jgi:hypothetical protein
MYMCLGDEHLVRGVVYSGEEGDRLGGWLYDSLPIYISLRASLSLIIINQETIVPLFHMLFLRV